MLNITKAFRGNSTHTHNPIPFDDLPSASKSADAGILGPVWANNYGARYGRGLAPRSRDILPGDAGAALSAVIAEDVYACLNARTQAMDSLDWQIKRLRGNTPQDDDEVVATRRDVVPMHPLAYGLRKFRSTYKYSLFHIWYYSKLVTGKAFIQPVKNIADVYRNLEWYNPVDTQIIAPLGVVDYFQYSGKGKSIRFLPLGKGQGRVPELLYDYYANLADEIEGQSPVEVALDSINIDRNHKRALSAFFRNGMHLGAVVSAKAGGILTEQQIDELIRELSAENVGVDNSFKNAYLPMEVDVNYPPPTDMRNQDSIAERSSTKIHKVLRVPASITGDMAETRYKEHKDMYDAWVALVILPDARDIRDVVNMDLMPLFDPSGETYFTFDEREWSTRVTQAEMDKREVAKTDLEAGAITIREYNDRVGIEMSEDASRELDVYLVPGDKLLVRRGKLGSLQGKPSYMPYQSPQTTIQQAQGMAREDEYPVANPPPPETNPEGEAPPLIAAEAEAIVDGAMPNQVNLDTDKDMQSGCVLLKLANNPDMLSLRKRVEDHLSGIETEWNDPESYHVTLAYAPSMTEDQMAVLSERLAEINLPDIELNIGSLNTFDDMGRYAVHFRIRRNAALLKLQERVVEACRESGIQLSTYSEPANYIPHITMGYASSKPKSVTYQSKITVKVDSLQLTDDDYEVVYEVGSPEQEALASQESSEDELKAWRRFTSKPQKRVFEIQHLRGDVECYVNALLAAPASDTEDVYLRSVLGEDAHAGIFTRAEKRLRSIKAIQATRLDFEEALEAVITEARAGNITRVRFGNILRDVIRRFGRMAYIDGLVDGGVTGAELDEEDESNITSLTKEQSQYVTGLGDTLYKEGGISDEEAKQKPAMWFNKTIAPFYTAGLSSADKNGYYEWVYGDTEHCEDCRALNGQVHRLKDYERTGWLPKAEKLECKGFNCKCNLVRRDKGRAKGKFPAKSHTHDHAA